MDARTSADNVLGAPGEGWKAAMTTLGHERATSVLNYQFSFRREMAALQELARRKGATEDPVLRDRLVDSLIGLEIMGYNNLRTLGSALRNGEFGPEASMGKYYWSKWHVRVHRARDGRAGPRRLARHRVGIGPGPGRRVAAPRLRAGPRRDDLRGDQRDPEEHHQRARPRASPRAGRRQGGEAGDEPRRAAVRGAGAGPEPHPRRTPDRPAARRPRRRRHQGRAARKRRRLAQLRAALPARRGREPHRRGRLLPQRQPEQAVDHDRPLHPRGRRPDPRARRNAPTY